MTEEDTGGRKAKEPRCQREIYLWHSDEHGFIVIDGKVLFRDN